MRRIRILAVAMAVLAAACREAPTGVRVSSKIPTPIPPQIVDVAGTWTGTMTYLAGSDRVTVLVTQDGERVHASWSTSARGEIRFEGAFLANRTKPDLAGIITFSHPLHCEMGPIRVGGEPTPSSMTLKGTGLWCFDAAPFSLQLLKSGPR
jgi:hypothetical protein